MSSIYGTPRMQSHPAPPITLDQQVALKGAAARLEREFEGVAGPETVEHFLTTSYAGLSARATISTFLPLLAERFARQRLQAFSRLEGSHRDGKPVVLFLCAHNAGRSQMALGFFTHHAGESAVAWSGGADPVTEVDPSVVAAMAERGIDISDEFPKPWTDEVLRAADVVVTMGCGDTCPVLPGKRYEDWSVADPAGLEVAQVRPIRDEVERRVLDLLAQLPAPGAST
jgi:protein-tyrosine-phosphatase